MYWIKNETSRGYGEPDFHEAQQNKTEANT